MLNIDKFLQLSFFRQYQTGTEVAVTVKCTCLQNFYDRKMFWSTVPSISWFGVHYLLFYKEGSTDFDSWNGFLGRHVFSPTDIWPTDIRPTDFGHHTFGQLIFGRMSFGLLTFGQKTYDLFGRYSCDCIIL
jgi:hypothetical protein